MLREFALHRADENTMQITYGMHILHYALLNEHLHLYYDDLRAHTRVLYTKMFYVHQF